LSTQVTEDRSTRLVDLLTAAQLDLLLVTDLVNVRYLTGYTGSNGFTLIGRDVRRFVTDFRYREQAAAEVDPSFERLEAPVELLDALTDAVPGAGVRLGFEEVHMSVAQYALVRERLRDRVELAPTASLVESLRAVKGAAEIAAVRAATVLADAAFERLLENGLAGRTERDVAIALEHDMILRGARRPNFDTIVAAGRHGALERRNQHRADLHRHSLRDGRADSV